MKKISLFIIIILSCSLSAKEHYVYRASIFKVLNAKLIIDVNDEVIDNIPVLRVTSNSTVRFLGNEIVNLDYVALNDITTFEPKINLECEHSDKQSEKNCRSVKFLPQGQFLYREFHNQKTVLEDLVYGSADVELLNIIDQQPSYNPNENKIYDIGSIVLLVKYLEINKDHRDQELFVAVNHQIAKIRMSYVEDIDNNLMWIKMIPIKPAPEDFKGEFPHKIIYDRRLKTVTEIHKKLPIVGDLVIKLDKKASGL